MSGKSWVPRPPFCSSDPGRICQDQTLCTHLWPALWVPLPDAQTLRSCCACSSWFLPSFLTSAWKFSCLSFLPFLVLLSEQTSWQGKGKNTPELAASCPHPTQQPTGTSIGVEDSRHTGQKVGMGGGGLAQTKEGGPQHPQTPKIHRKAGEEREGGSWPGVPGWDSTQPRKVVVRI